MTAGPGPAGPAGRALFDRLPRLADLVPFMPLADGLPTPVEQVDERLWIQRDDLTSSGYGGNKVRKLEFVLPVAARRGGPVVSAGGSGSHHLLATAIYAGALGLDVDAVVYPQPETDDSRRTEAALAGRTNVHVTRIPHPYLMPAALAGRLAALAGRRPFLLWPGASTPVGTLGYVSAGLELAGALGRGDEPDVVVVPFGSGGTAAGLALGLALAGWQRARVVAVRVTDRVVANRATLSGLEAATAGVLALGGWRPRPGRLEVDGAWAGPGYGHPTAAGRQASKWAGRYGLALEPTYTAKAFAAALRAWREGERVVFVQTFGGLGAGPARARTGQDSHPAPY